MDCGLAGKGMDASPCEGIPWPQAWRDHTDPRPQALESSPVGRRRDVFPGAVLLTLPRLPAPSPRGGQVFTLLPGNGARAKLAKI